MSSSKLEPCLAHRLESDVRGLADDIGERSMFTEGSMAAAVAYIEARLTTAGLTPHRHAYRVPMRGGLRCVDSSADNLVAEVPGTCRPEEILVIGAHYDSVRGSPGANDNASAVAVLLALAERFAERAQPRTVRFIAFANEEPPFYLSAAMGSYAYAGRTRRLGERICAMMAMDGLGYFSDAPGSQRYPLPGLGVAYPDSAHFIGFITRLRDAGLMRRGLRAFRLATSVAAEGAALPSFVPGVGWSDHWAFWQHGYPGFLVTDTLPFRDPTYHSPCDTAERLDYRRMAQLTLGLEAVVECLAE